MNRHQRGTPPRPAYTVSVVVPAHNEEDNIAPLMEQFAELSRKAAFRLEVVLVDDGSQDRTLPRAVDAQRTHRFLRIVSLPYRRGLSEALRAGFTTAKGDILVFYPADRQFHPADIPRMVEKVRSGYDLVTGRKIGQYSKRFVSSFYNRLSRLLFPSIQVSDLNSVKAFRKELISVFDYRHDWHRFWVAIVSEAGYRIGEVDVTLYDRQSGRSKFGIWRIPGAVLDLLAVKFQYHTMRRPLWYFGLAAMALIALAIIIGGFAVYQRYVLGSGNRVLIFLVMTLGLSGIVFFALGFLAESVAAVRQQVEAMRSGPRYQVFSAGPELQRDRGRDERRNGSPGGTADTRRSGERRPERRGPSDAGDGRRRQRRPQPEARPSSSRPPITARPLTGDDHAPDRAEPSVETTPTPPVDKPDSPGSTTENRPTVSPATPPPDHSPQQQGGGDSDASSESSDSKPESPRNQYGRRGRR